MKDRSLKAVGKAAFFLIAVWLIIGSGCKQGNKENSQGQNTDNDNIEAYDTLLSIEDLSIMLRADPLNADIFSKRAGLRALQSQFDEAISDISLAIRLDSLNPEYYIMQAEYYIFGGQPNSAKKSLTLCLNLFPNNTDIMLKLAEIHFYLQEYTQSQLILKNVTALNDDLGQIYFLQGLIYIENRDTTNGIIRLRYAVEKDPQFFSAYMTLGRIHASMNDDLAIDYYRSAVDIMPDSYQARYNLALFLQDHDYLIEAENEYNFIIQTIDSTTANPFYNLGYINLIYRQEFDIAIEFFTVAIEKDAEYLEAWYNRGFTYEVMGKLKLARNDYEKSLSIQTNYPLSIKALNRLDDGKPFKYN